MFLSKVKKKASKNPRKYCQYLDGVVWEKNSKMLDLLLIAILGFLGSFGHCAGMCGP